MFVRIVDRARNIRNEGAIPKTGDIAAVIGDLKASHAASLHTGMIEFECDQTFIDKYTPEVFGNVPFKVIA